MIYLFSQIAISLALAAIVGGAAGWIAHRARAGKQIKELSSVVSKQQQQVKEAQTQVSLLTGDFDDLKQNSEAQIAELRQDNQKIPALNQNLEKSQLLVRQLMQQHKAETVELLEENEKLMAKAKQVNDREQAFTKLQAELDIAKRRNQQLAGESADSDTAETSANVTNIRESMSSKGERTTNLESATQSELPLSGTSATDKKPSPSEPSPADNHSAGKTQQAGTKATSKKNSPEQSVDAINVTGSNKNTLKSAAKSDRTTSTDTNAIAASAATPSAAETEAELKLLRDQLAEDLPSKEPITNKANKNTVTSVESEAANKAEEPNVEPLFDPVPQHDDLKQIFGIGPVTEKTLNKLGITAYSQLAELKQHDIEKIADALQIFPGRIERDNWVGGARAQLEEVLENL